MRYALLLIVTLVSTSPCLGADDYPARTVRVIVPYGPGGNTDIAARLISKQLSEQLGKSFVVDNRPGATGTIGSTMVAKSAPDGYTIGLMDTSWSIVPSLYKSLPYYVLRDFVPITYFLRAANVLVVRPSLNARTIKEFIALAQANPGKFNFGSSGAGSPNHLNPELFKKAAKVNIVHIPFKAGAGATIIALLGGEIDMLISPVPPVLTHIMSGKMRALAVTTDGPRLPSLSDVPSMSEAGIPGMTSYYWAGLAGPADMPKEIVSKLQAEVVKAINVPAVRERIVGLSAEPVVSSQDEFAKFVRAEVQRWGEVIKSAGITPE